MDQVIGSALCEPDHTGNGAPAKRNGKRAKPVV
jgi:hypothetical protein